MTALIDNTMPKHPYPEHRHLLYSPRHEHDACGVGFVADVAGRRSHTILEMALEAVVNLTHRGAVSADGKTGDGAGVLTQIPHAFFARELAAHGIALRSPADLAIGMLFLPGDDEEARDRCIQIAESSVCDAGLRFLGWRHVPIDRAALGEKALATCPEVRQALIAPGDEDAPIDVLEYERSLYLIRKRIEREVEAAGIDEFYAPSFSCRTLVYKGLMVAPQLTRFFPDLADPLFETALAVFHQRYSTNTFPTWFLAQPFRLLGHNGEINTVQGNENWTRAREPQLVSQVWGDRIGELVPIIQAGGSDSAKLDNVFELLVMSGRHPLHAMMMLVPEAYQQMPNMDPELGAFYEYHATLSEPWDGPAALAFSDGEVVAATLDRNGLRPARYVVTNDGLVILASEAGLVKLDPERIVEKGRLGPGMMIAVDTAEGRFLSNDEIKARFARRQPYKEWLADQLVRPHLLQLNANGRTVPEPVEEFSRQQKAFGYGTEDLDKVLLPMAVDGKEPVGSMGDDTPIAVLSEKPRLLYTYFKQRFAQVSNPPIDPLREKLVMSLNTAVGARGCVLEETRECARLIKFTSPILTRSEFEWLTSQEDPKFRSRKLPALFDVSEGPEGLEPALNRLCEEAALAAADGFSLLVVSDDGVGPSRAPIPMLLAVSAVHHHLIQVGRRMAVSLVVETGEAREDHHYACLIGYGASVIYPYLAYRSVAEMAESGKTEEPVSAKTAMMTYKAAVENGLYKIMSKMGISTVSSYRGAQIFEALGLSADVIDRYFSGTDSRVGGVGLTEIATDVLRYHGEAYGEDARLHERGIYRFRKGGEYHAYNPTVFKALHDCVRSGDYDRAYKAYASLVNHRPPTALRDLMTFRPENPIPIEEVEPAEEIVRRFCTPGMSHGALSREAHEVLSVAMNRIGAKSNSGEGGEARERFYPYGNGDWGNSRIKQVASGRFGVTPEYLVSADELEIKMAQGSKPGEGGQIPGHKVSEEIATIRHSVPGVTLVSPPPHHDIYSIEDLAQLIYDLKRVNGRAKVAVKLVSESGVGTVAAGVAKGYADVIHISGHDGGTGASPLGSIKNAGIPWELGLAETQQVLVLNDLRSRVKVRSDGGMKTGRDVIIAAMLGAEEYAFGTAALVSAGCVMARQCHMNNCPVGVATQRPELRAKFPGTPEHVINFMLFVAQEVREFLAQLGFRRLDEIIGHTELLRPRTDISLPKTDAILLDLILADPDPSGEKPRRSMQERNDRPDEPLDDEVCRAGLPAVESGTGERIVREWAIANTDRTVGARLSGQIARHFKSDGLREGAIQFTFYGSAGQSFGAFCNQGMMLILEGEAQDYVGKGMAGGEIVVRPPASGTFATHENAIMGNTVMYGATGGGLYAAGRAGERFCVRNSGGCAVVEGVGDHGCEYMTGGVVVVLGECGRNFAAGMSGGLAFVLDEKCDFEHRLNAQMVDFQPVHDALDAQLLRSMIERHVEYTGSRRAGEILERWEEFLPMFQKVVPHPSEATARPQDTAALEASAMRAIAAQAHVAVGSRR
jgi:glutamate synthase domain-containing protein 2/glutamate synthase domain-containing protein 1/glutamate synthase domain-containing protein 3